MDISYKVNRDGRKYRFNYRVAAIIEVNGKILIHKFEGADYFFLPGGRVKIGETSQEAIVRELKEELDVDIETSSLPFVVENFFEYAGEIFHEISMYYKLSPLNSNELPADGEVRDKVQFMWKTCEEISELNLQPEFLASELKKMSNNTKHIVNYCDSLAES